MKKILILLFGVFLLTGCDVEYNLVYEDNVLNESLNVVSANDDVIDGQPFTSLIDQYYEIPLLVDYKIQLGDMRAEDCDYCKFYNKNIINNNGKYGINLNYTYEDKKEFANSSLVFTLFDSISVGENTIKATNAKNVFDSYKNLDEIIVTFKTDKRVIETNCDEKKDGKYYWYINSSNYENKIIRIDIDNSITVIEMNEDTEGIIGFIFIGLGILLFLGIVFVFIKFKNSNKK